MKIRDIKPEWISGDPWKYCDICGLKYRQSETKKMWNGLIACKECYDPKPLEAPELPDPSYVEDPRPLGDITYSGTVLPDDL